MFELRDSVEAERGVPVKLSAMPYVYVGYARNRRKRLSEHRTGRYSADKKWAPHYVGARRDLYSRSGPYADEDEALEAEELLARQLTDDKYTVVAKTGSPISIHPTRMRR